MQSLKELYRIGKGPSSSHTMGPERAARDFLQAYPQSARYCAVLYGSLARTGRGHLTDEAIRSVFGDRQLEIQFDLQTETPEHPNTLEFIAYDGNGDETARTVYLSVGGGTVRKRGEGELQKKCVYPFRYHNIIYSYNIYCVFCISGGNSRFYVPLRGLTQRKRALAWNNLVEHWETLRPSSNKG